MLLSRQLTTSLDLCFVSFSMSAEAMNESSLAISCGSERCCMANKYTDASNPTRQDHSEPPLAQSNPSVL